MANSIRNFNCDDETWDKFQNYCASKKTQPSQMLLRFINSCIEASTVVDVQQDESINSTITQILDLVYNCKTKIEEQEQKISKLTDNVHDLEMKLKSNETNISILLENNQELENSNTNFQHNMNEILNKIDGLDQQYYQSLKEILFYLDTRALNKLTKSQLRELLKENQIESSPSELKDKLIKLCQENGIHANECRDKINLPKI